MPCYQIALSVALIAFLGTASQGQNQAQKLPTPPLQPELPAPPAATAIAATVNGQPITELAVYRAIGKRADQTAELRTEVVNYLIDNALVDLYLDQMKLDVDAKEVDKNIQKVKTELEAAGKTLAQLYSELYLTEADLRAQILATVRWDKFIQQYGSEKVLRDFYDSNKAIFDGSAVRAKHILAVVPPNNPQAVELAKARIFRARKQIEEQVAQGMATAASLDNIQLQKKKMQLLNDAFAAVAAKESDCPTKYTGGELNWFPRTGGGRVSEPFATAAFALKPWTLSDPVLTEFGYHLILCVDSKPGVERKYEEIRDVVRDVYADKMRAAVVTRMRPTAKIAIYPAPPARK